ncbi:hypothetical protein QA597_08145 [Marinilabiliaceae bacterium ANBcel2]|nr:hypothetical protein [Marinilabiliaceae bacterium ANBcel2]
MKNFKKCAVYIAAVIMLFCGFSCQFFSSDKKAAEPGEILSEGTIIYSISYPGESSSPGKSFLYPSNMTLFFSGENIRTSFKGGMNLYGLDFLHSAECDSFFTLLNVLDRKFFVPSERSEAIFLFGSDDNVTIEYDDSDAMRNIGGYESRKAYIYHDNNDAFMSVWFTDEVGVEKPFPNTPFSNIPGIITEFTLNYENVNFHVKAKRVIRESHSDELFVVPPPGYSRTTLEEIEELIASLMR